MFLIYIPLRYQMRHHLVGKNVAADIADRLCQSVCEKLEGTTKGSFQSLSAVVRKGLEESLTQILSPKRHIDVLRDIRDAQREKRPFTITFCGVNGARVLKVCAMNSKGVCCELQAPDQSKTQSRGDGDGASLGWILSNTARAKRGKLAYGEK